MLGWDSNPQWNPVSGTITVSALRMGSLDYFLPNIPPPWDYWWVVISVFLLSINLRGIPHKISQATGRLCYLPLFPLRLAFKDVQSNTLSSLNETLTSLLSISYSLLINKDSNLKPSPLIPIVSQYCLLLRISFRNIVGSEGSCAAYTLIILPLRRRFLRLRLITPKICTRYGTRTRDLLREREMS